MICFRHSLNQTQWFIWFVLGLRNCTVFCLMVVKRRKQILGSSTTTWNVDIWITMANCLGKLWSTWLLLNSVGESALIYIKHFLFNIIWIRRESRLILLNVAESLFSCSGLIIVTAKAQHSTWRKESLLRFLLTAESCLMLLSFERWIQIMLDCNLKN